MGTCTYKDVPQVLLSIVAPDIVVDSDKEGQSCMDGVTP